MTDDDELARWRMWSHFGDDSGAGGPAGVARRAAGLQAQDAGAVRRALQVRGAGDPAEPQRAYRAGEVVTLALMRGTLHLVPGEDARWLLGIFGARNLAAGARRRRELGLTEEVLARAVEVLPEVLAEAAEAAPADADGGAGSGPGGAAGAAGGLLSRAELVAAVRARGAAVDPEGQAPAHLAGYLGALGLLCRSADVARGKPGYGPLPAGRADAPEGGAAVAELARWHAGAFGPVGPEDFAGWSGLGVTVARRAFAAAGLAEVAPGLFTLPGAVPPPAGPPLERRVGWYDTFLLGYRDRSLMIDAEHSRLVYPGGGLIRPAVLRDGLVVGTWRVEEGAEVAQLWR